MTAPLEQRIAYRRLNAPSRLRNSSAKPTTSARPAGTIVAELTDGPLAGSTREVAAVEGRPPKTIDVDLGDGSVRYCLAEWEQSGHSAVYGFLYEV